jgi:hypothetical protein
VVLTGDGARRISALRRCWDDRVLRNHAARDAFLAWLHDQQRHGRGASDLKEFFNDPRSACSGQFFSMSDIGDAATYLADKKLIDATRRSREGDLLSARITANGLDCIERGGSVAEYANQPAKTSITYSFSAPVSGTNVAIGDGATQHATITSADLASVRTLIQAIAEALPGLGFDAQALNEAKDAASQVAVEMRQPQPDHHRLRAALGKMRDLLAQAGSQALAAVLSGAIDYERSKLGLPPAG